MRSLYSGVQCLVCGGKASNVIPEHNLSDDVNNYLRRLMGPEELRAKVRSCIETGCVIFPSCGVSVCAVEKKVA